MVRLPTLLCSRHRLYYSIASFTLYSIAKKYKVYCLDLSAFQGSPSYFPKIEIVKIAYVDYWYMMRRLKQSETTLKHLR